MTYAEKVSFMQNDLMQKIPFAPSYSCARKLINAYLEVAATGQFFMELCSNLVRMEVDGVGVSHYYVNGCTVTEDSFAKALGFSGAED